MTFSAALGGPRGDGRRAEARALDTEADHCEHASVEDVGMRHRAAYRFMRDNPDGLAIVISHDGGVSFVANRGGEAVLWEQSLSP